MYFLVAFVCKKHGENFSGNSMHHEKCSQHIAINGNEVSDPEFLITKF